MIRSPAVAGQFYPDRKTSLERTLSSLVRANTHKEEAIGVVSPHAGYVYSGPVAGSLFSSIYPKKTYIILGPNHTGSGLPFGVDSNQFWKTPLGEVQVDRDLSDLIIKNSDNVKYDSACNIGEHSIEVQIPFLQFLGSDFTIVPIVISYATLNVYRAIGQAIADSIEESGRKEEILIIASSDMTHYESQETAKRKDSIAIEAMLKLDEEALVNRVEELDISMCGFAPACIMLVAAKKLGASKARLVRYQTSGDSSGDYSSVVGYAGLVIS